MKIRILDRILVTLSGLLALAFCAALGAQIFFQKDVAGFVTKLLNDPANRVWLIIALAAILLIGIYCVLMLFRHRGRNDRFVMQKTESGELAISLKAMESMVQKCLDPHKELSVQSVKLENQKGGLLIRIRGTVAGGVSIPLTVDALQQQIKQYVTACSGVEVKMIRVMIESSGPDTTDSLFAIEAPTARALPGSGTSREEKPAAKEPEGLAQEELEQIMAEIPAPDASEAEGRTEKEETPVVVPAAAAAAAELLKQEAPPEEDDRPLHQRLFSNPEEPCVMPMPPEETPADAEKAEEKKDEAGEEAPAGNEPEEKDQKEGSDQE